MTPKQWIAKEDTTASALARKWGLSKTTVLRPVNGDSPPSWQIVLRFWLESKGAVDVAGWAKTRPGDKTALFEKPSGRGRKKA